MSTISSGHEIDIKWIPGCASLDICYTISHDFSLTVDSFPWLSTPVKMYGVSAYTLYTSGAVAVSQSWVDQSYIHPNHQRPALTFEADITFRETPHLFSFHLKKL